MYRKYVDIFHKTMEDKRYIYDYYIDSISMSGYELVKANPHFYVDVNFRVLGAVNKPFKFAAGYKIGHTSYEMWYIDSKLKCVSTNYLYLDEYATEYISNFYNMKSPKPKIPDPNDIVELFEMMKQNKLSLGEFT